MAASRWNMYDTAILKLNTGIIDLDTHTFKCALFLSTSNCETETFDELADLTNQVANGFGYTTGGVALTGVTVTDLAGVTTFDSDEISWVASGGSITARFAVIYDDTVAGDPLLCYCLLDTSDVTATDTQELEITIPTTGILTVQQAL